MGAPLLSAVCLAMLKKDQVIDRYRVEDLLGSGGMLRLLFSAITTTDEIQRLASEYFTARVLGAPAALCNLAAMGWLLGVQEPRSCRFINVVINTTNIVLDYLLALQLGWGMRGVAFATALAQFAGAAASVLAPTQPSYE